MSASSTSLREDVVPRYRWRPVPARAYEIWYGKLVYSHGEGKCGFWFRYELLTRPRGESPRADVWAIHFDAIDPSGNWHAHESFDIERIRVSPDVLAVALERDTYLAWDAVGGCVRAVGEVKRGTGRVRWDLRFPPRGPSFRYVSPSLLAQLFAASNAATPFEDVRYDGSLTLDGEQAAGGHERRELRNCAGMLGHIWGSRQADGWCWLHANDFVGADGRPARAALEALTLARGDNSSAATTVFLRLDDEVYEANGPLDLLHGNKGLVSRGGYRVESAAGGAHLEAYASVDAGRTQTFELPDTGASRLTNTSSLLAELELVIRRPRDAAPVRLVCRSGAALERVERL
ncbi:MAG: hypothetical protein HY303_02280 [Candidatus Wallbacteria bacterium]|nr:hypothetical protein [Candidatus Wallbacteria bacterium]